MDAQALLAERSELFSNAIAFKHNPRVPISSTFFTWKYLDAGYDLNVALRDLDILEKVNLDFHETYQFDAYSDFGWRNSIRVSDALGGKFHYVDKTGEYVIADDRVLIEADEYHEYMADPDAFYWSKAFKRYCKDDLTIAELNTAMMEFLAFGQFTTKMIDKCINQCGALITLTMSGLIMTPVEDLFNSIRGIKGLALDIRKNREALQEMLDFLWETKCQRSLEAGLTADWTGYATPLSTVFLGHSILSVKQFEELYWPYLKKIVDAAIAHNKPIYIFSESSFLRFAEFFEDIPKGIMLIHPEQDDIFEVRKRLPNIALAGGMPTSMLGHATPQECIDYAKRLIDELGEGYVFSQDKMISYRNDVKRENLLAVNDFVRNYAY
jgi:hypothetical protein